MSESFEKVTLDIIGPLPRTSQVGINSYILTMMRLFSKYPKTIPLKRVDTESVLEAIIDILPRHGIPKTILTDQGSVFMSQGMVKLYEMLEVKHVQMSFYHLQSDGTRMVAHLFERNVKEVGD